MKLTLWKKSEKDRNSVIYIDNEPWGILHDRILRSLFPRLDREGEISSREFKTLQIEIYQFLRQKLWDWLAAREHSSCESIQFLKRYRAHRSIINQLISESVDKNYIDDERFSRLLIESMLARRKSPFQIKAKLIEKKLTSALWEPILEELSTPELILSNLEAQTDKALQKYAHLDSKTCFEKCLAFLFRKGFDLDEAKAAINRKLTHKS